MLTKHPPRRMINRSSHGVRMRRIIRLTEILLPIDFSPESKNALHYAVAFADQFGASLTLLHIVEPILCEADFGYGPVTRSSPNQQRLKRAKARLNRFTTKSVRERSKAIVLVRTGVAASEIVQTARQLQTDLIIMGNRGQSDSGRISTAEQVLRHAPCPVFIVRKKEHEFVECRKLR